MPRARRDDNFVPSLIAKSDLDDTVVVLEADPSSKALKTDLVNSSGETVVDDSGGVKTNTTPMATKVTISGSITYVAEAPVGTSQASAAWRCRQIDESDDTLITWADGDADFDNVATDLTALSYS